MKIFLSWSEENSQSHKLAQAFKDWLPEVFHSVMPFLSSKDIDAGVQWFPKLKAELEAADFGIVCLTKSNLTKPYIMLESGAMAMRVDAAKLVPVLCDVSETELGKNPLTAFNYVHLTSEDVFKLIESIDNSLTEEVPDETLKKRFDKQWPDLEGRIKIIIGTPDKETPKKKVSLDDSVEEMLSMLRLLVRKQEPGELSLAAHLRNKEYFDALGSDNEKVNVFFARPGSGKTKLFYDLLETYMHEDEPKPKDREEARKPKSGGNEPTNDEDE